MRSQFFIGLDLGQCRTLPRRRSWSGPTHASESMLPDIFSVGPWEPATRRSWLSVARLVRRLNPAPILAVDATGVG